MERIKEIRLLRRIFLVFATSLSIMAGAAFFYIFMDTKRDQITDLTNAAKVIQSYYHLSFHQWELSLASVGNRLMEIEDDSQRLAYANSALEVYENELLAFGLADTSGQVITFTGRLVNDSLPNLRKSEQTRRSFELGLERGGMSLGESYYFENVSDWILPIRVPLKDQEGNIIAVNTSAIDYSSMVEELEAFGFSDKYRIQLVNNDFNTTQIFYPLEKAQYEEVLGTELYSSYTDIDTIINFNDTQILTGIDPMSKKNHILVCIDIMPVNHRLMISIEESSLNFLILDRFRLVFIIYLLLIFSSLFLYRFIKRKLKESVLQLRTEKANLKSIIESTSDIIGLFDTEKRLVEFNSVFHETSMATDNLPLSRGMDLLSQIPKREQAAIFSRFIGRGLKGEKFQEEIVYPTDAGDLIFKFTYNPVYDEDEVVGLTLFAEDITEIRSYQNQLEDYSKSLEKKVEERTSELAQKNKELEKGYKKLEATQEQLIRAEKMASLGILSAGIGHEINNPLNFIKHGAISLKDQIEKDYPKSDYADYFFAIEEGVRRAASIVSGLSHFSRTGTMGESCNIHQILDNSLILLRSQFKEKEIEVVKEYEAEQPIITGNEGKLHQVLTNIITNAAQAIKNQGKVSIKTKNLKGSIQIEITDTGEGMSKSVLNKITDPFFTTKDPGEGTGLGLFICQMIMEEHQGQMNVTSKKGEGTTFTLIFKLNDESQE